MFVNSDNYIKYLKLWLITLFSLIILMVAVGGLTRLTDSGLQNYLKQEKQKIVLLLLKMMDKFYLEKKLEVSKKFLFNLKMAKLQII